MRLAVIVLFALMLAACATSGPIAAPVIGGVAAALAALDQLLASGMIDPVQYEALKSGFVSVGELSTAVDSVKESAKGGLSPEAVAGIGGGTTAALLALLKAWGSFSNLRKAAKNTKAA